MWTKPNHLSPEFRRIRDYCSEQRLNLRASRTYAEAIAFDGDYAVFCAFSNSLLFSSDSLAEVAHWLRLEGSNNAY